MNLRSIEIQLLCEDDEQFAQQCAEIAEALVQINVWEIRHDGDRLPCCLGCGEIEYEPPQPCGSTPGSCNIRPRATPCQTIRDARGIYAAKRGTCFDLACERAARCRLEGIEATAVIVQRLDRGRPIPGQFHAYVETPDGVEDPALELSENPGECGGSCSCGDDGHETDEGGI